MYPSEFIISELKSFITLFPKTRVRYENDLNSVTHSIEVIPNDVYHLDKNYVAWETIFFDKFINKFPEQSICFISDDAIVGLDKVDFEITGTEFISDNYTFNKDCVLLPSEISIKQMDNSFDYNNINSFTNGITVQNLASLQFTLIPPSDLVEFKTVFTVNDSQDQINSIVRYFALAA